MSGPVTNEEILAYLVDLSANIAMQFAELQDAQLENFITLKNILNLEVIPELNDLSANIAQQFALVDAKLENIQSTVGKTDQTLTLEFVDLYVALSQQTNDINTNTNVALSAAVNAINTNTNDAVGGARDNINAHINPLLLNNLLKK